MKNITVHYCSIDYDQQFAAIDQWPRLLQKSIIL